MITHFRNNISWLKTYIDGSIKYSLPKAHIAEIEPTNIKPNCYTIVTKSLEWHAAMNKEFDALLKNWNLVHAHDVIGKMGFLA